MTYERILAIVKKSAEDAKIPNDEPATADSLQVFVASAIYQVINSPDFIKLVSRSLSDESRSADRARGIQRFVSG